MKQILGLVAIMFCTSTLVNAQTIADRARQERAKRQASSKVLVITNETLKDSPSAAKTEEKPAAEAKPEAAAEPAGNGHDEKWWRGQFEKVRTEIQRLEAQIPVLESNLNTANREFLTRSYDPDGRGKRAIDEAKAKLEAAKSDRALAQTRLDQLEEELRRSGSPAGWAR